jgi:hypothetical protein
LIILVLFHVFQRRVHNTLRSSGRKYGMITSVTKVYLNSIKIVQFAPHGQVIIDTSHVKWRDNEHFCCKTQIKYISFRTCVKVSMICPLGKINNLSNCQRWTKALHGGLLCLHNSKSKAGSSLTWKCPCLGRSCQSFFGIFRAVE